MGRSDARVQVCKDVAYMGAGVQRFSMPGRSCARILCGGAQVCKDALSKGRKSSRMMCAWAQVCKDSLCSGEACKDAMNRGAGVQECYVHRRRCARMLCAGMQACKDAMCKGASMQR